MLSRNPRWRRLRKREGNELVIKKYLHAVRLHKCLNDVPELDDRWTYWTKADKREKWGEKSREGFYGYCGYDL